MFAQYAMAATEEALIDADWKPDISAFVQREMTVCSSLYSGCYLCLQVLTVSGRLPGIRNWEFR